MKSCYHDFIIMNAKVNTCFSNFRDAFANANMMSDIKINIFENETFKIIFEQ